jgi:hypothetical protein
LGAYGKNIATLKKATQNEGLTPLCSGYFLSATNI